MGSATNHALDVLRDSLAQHGSNVDAATAEDLFASARAIGGSVQLRAAIVDASAEPETKAALITAIFGSKVSAPALALLVATARQRWSEPVDAVAAIEELGIRALAKTASASEQLDAELFSVSRAVSSDAQLELALRSRLADPATKAALVDRLLDGKASSGTVSIVRQLVLQPRGRSIRESLRQAADVVADEANKTLATVTSASALSPEQLARLRDSLSKRYAHQLTFNTIVDPSLIGGLRVQVGDDVIDSSVSARLDDVRQKLAG